MPVSCYYWLFPINGTQTSSSRLLDRIDSDKQFRVAGWGGCLNNRRKSTYEPGRPTICVSSLRRNNVRDVAIKSETRKPSLGHKAQQKAKSSPVASCCGSHNPQTRCLVALLRMQQVATHYLGCLGGGVFRSQQFQSREIVSILSTRMPQNRPASCIKGARAKLSLPFVVIDCH